MHRLAVLILSLTSLVACGPEHDPATDDGASDAGQACVWPSGPYGVAQNDTLPEHFVWEGYAEGSDEPGTVALSDYFDCDGSNGIRALLFITAVFSCNICQAEAAGLEANMNEWATMGIRVVTLMLDSPGGGHPTVEDAQLWKSNFQLEAVAVVADPNESFVPIEIKATPQHSIVDPRTMRVVVLREGYDEDYAGLLELAAENAD